MPCMEYCCHVWAGAPSWYSEILDKLQKQIYRTDGPAFAYSEILDKLEKQIYRTVGPTFATSLEPSVHRRNVARLSLLL